MRYFVTSKLQKVTKSYKKLQKLQRSYKKKTPIYLKYSDLNSACNLVTFVT